MYLAYAVLTSSCVDEAMDGVSEMIGTGEIVRAVAIDGENSISGEKTLCVEVLPPTDLRKKPDYASISDLVRSKNLFDGWSYVEIRTYSGVDESTLFELSKAATESGDRDILFISWSCPD